MRKIGYVRVSTDQQLVDRQISGIQSLCDEMHVEVMSGATKKRPVYQKIVRKLRSGDMFVVLDLDRAFRSAADALTELERLRGRGIHFLIVDMAIDTTTPAGIFVYTIMAGYAEFERRTLSERTKQGLAAARRRGATLGRPRKLNDAKLGRARALLAAKLSTIPKLAGEYEVAPWTLVRALRREELGSVKTPT